MTRNAIPDEDLQRLERLLREWHQRRQRRAGTQRHRRIRPEVD